MLHSLAPLIKPETADAVIFKTNSLLSNKIGQFDL